MKANKIRYKYFIDTKNAVVDSALESERIDISNAQDLIVANTIEIIRDHLIEEEEDAIEPIRPVGPLGPLARRHAHSDDFWMDLSTRAEQQFLFSEEKQIPLFDNSIDHETIIKLLTETFY